MSKQLLRLFVPENQNMQREMFNDSTHTPARLTLTLLATLQATTVVTTGRRYDSGVVLFQLVQTRLFLRADCCWPIDMSHCKQIKNDHVDDVFLFGKISPLQVLIDSTVRAWILFPAR